jgi:hypothetical protein
MDEQVQDFKDVKQVLQYLEMCEKDNRASDRDASGDRVYRAALWVGRISIALVVVAFIVALLWKYGGWWRDDYYVIIDSVMSAVFLCVGVQTFFLLILVWRGFQDWRNKKIVSYSLIDRDERRARKLLSCSESLLGYARDWLKRESDRRERRANVIMKDAGLIPVLGLAFAMWKGWEGLWKDVGAEKLQGLNVEGSQMLGHVLLITLIAMLVLGTSMVRTAVGRYAYRMELIDVALKLKALKGEGDTRDESLPVDVA